MADPVGDDFAKPVPPRKKPRAPRMRFSIPWRTMLGGIAGLSLLAGGLYVAFVDDPLGGEPHALVSIVERPAEPAPAPRAAAVERTGPANARQVEADSGVSVVRPAGDGAPGAIIIRMPDPVGSGASASPDDRLLERSRYGGLPQIAPDGSRPADRYARPAPPMPAGVKARVAIVVGGLGISQSATGEAMAKLPGAVTLAFAPYGGGLERNVARARERGYEVMLQAPMEPFDYPDNDPGPHTLLAQAKPAENRERLHWLLGRFPGYVGVINFLGAKLTADETALSPILQEIGARGLFFVDDGSSARSQAVAVARRVQLPALKADLIVDASARPEAIESALARLEALALQKGSAVGVGSGLPVTVERIARWAEGLEKRGLQLVPVSALAREPPSN